MKNLLQLPLTFLAFIFGRIDWTAPPWLQPVVEVMARFRRNRPGMFWGGLVFLLALVGLYVYLDSLPKPAPVEVVIEAPGLTPNVDDAKPGVLTLRFHPPGGNTPPPDDGIVQPYQRIMPPEPVPSGMSVARIDLVGEEVTEGVRLEPAKPGTWRWLDDHTLQFESQTDWPAGTRYEIHLDASAFNEGILLPEPPHFDTPAFTIELIDPRFYQDPADATIRRVVATYRFSHPVEQQSFEKALTLRLQDADGKGDAFPYEVTYDKRLREAYVTSTPVALPERSSYMRLTLGTGVQSMLGGAPATAPEPASVLVPDRFSYLRVDSTALRIERNPDNEPQQLLLLELTDDIDEKVLQQHLQVWLLPENTVWSSPREVSEAILKQSEPLTVQQIPNPRSHARQFSFVLDVPERRHLYIKLDRGLNSINGFISNNVYDQVFVAPDYPKEVMISGEGSVLTHSGEQQLALVTRGLGALKFRVGRVLEHQVNHLVSQTGGDVSNPEFMNWSFNAQSIADFSEQIVPLTPRNAREATYASLDLRPFMAEMGKKGDARFGLFFVEALGWDTANNSEVYGIRDQRLILVTDLGVIVKRNRDNTQDVFVQSIQSGDPVAGAKVRLLGKNGIALFERTTDAQGHAEVPAATDYRDAQQPTVYVIQIQQDTSFIPYDRYTRQINLSRYDIGGVSLPYQPDGGSQQALNAYGFSDRGIYRPGETVTLAFIVKQANLGNVEDIPLEMVIVGPQGNEVAQNTFQLPEKGVFDYRWPTDATVPTGFYQVSLHLVRSQGRDQQKQRGEQIGATNFRIEEFLPDTMKIESRVSGSNGLPLAAEGWFAEPTLNVDVSLQNLFGAPAQARRVQAQLIVEPTVFAFDEYEGYVFSGAGSAKQEQPLRVDERLDAVLTDDNGRARITLDLARFSQGSYNLRVVSEGFDQAGGRSVSAVNQLLISPQPQQVAYKPDGDLAYVHAGSERSVQWLAINHQLAPVALSGLTLRKIAIEQISTLVKQNDGTYAYQTVTREQELSNEAFSLEIGGAALPLDTKTPGQFAWEVQNASSARLARLDYTVVGDSNLSDKLTQNAELQLKLNKSDYRPGEAIELSLNAPYDGAGLISIESERVHQFKWFKAKAGSSLHSIVVPDALEGSAYVNVAFVRDAGSKAVFTSPLSYAVAPFSIDQSRRRVDVTLDVAKLVRPGSDMTVTYSTSQPSRLLVFAVDEGILQVANYQTPDPLAHFLQKRMLEVSTMQIMDLILPEFSLLKKLSASGGDMAEMAAQKMMLADNLNPFTRKTDQPAVFWAGIHEAGPDAKNLTFALPDTFSGSLRVMAVAVADEALGQAETSTLVRGPFVISPNTLTQAAPGDEFDVTVGVANLLEGSGPQAELMVRLEPSETLKVVGADSVTLRIDEGSEGKAGFRVKAGSAPGEGVLRFVVAHASERAQRTATLSIRPATPFVSDFVSGHAANGQASIAQTRARFDALAEQSIAASSSPLVLVDGLSRYLEHFPHGCTEQVVSKVFPLVGLMSHPAWSSRRAEVQSFFDALIGKLRERQNGDGGFVFWPGQTESAHYPTLYVLHFLIDAEAQGYPVPHDLLSRAQDYVQQLAAAPGASLQQARERAYAIYLLTRRGVVTTNYLADLQESLGQQAWRQDLLAVYMAATWQLLQKSDEAQELLGEFEPGASQSLPADDFHTPLAQSAQYVYLLSRHFGEAAQALSGDTVLQLLDPIFRGEYNTLSAAYSILALGAYGERMQAAQTTESIRFAAILANGQKEILKHLSAPFPQASYPTDAKTVEVAGEQPLFWLNAISGFDLSAPDKPVREGIEVYRDFLDADGKVVTAARQGQVLTVRLKVRALTDRPLTNIAVLDLLPGGFEVERDSIDRGGDRMPLNWRADYIDIREDRIVYYGSFDQSVRELRYQVKATASGSFIVPSTYATSMYDRSIRAVTPAGQFEVRVGE